jgi:uncharacterized protein YggU (UPF0235/DUF167 family)
MTDNDRPIVNELAKIVFNTKEGIVVSLYVIPGSKTSFLEFKQGELLYHSSASCKNHGVNIDLIRYLSKNIGGKPVIVKGWSTRKKLVVFHGINRDQFIVKMEKLINNYEKR